MISQSVSTRYPIAAEDPVRGGTIGLQFSTAGTAAFTTMAGDVCTCTVVAGQEIETGPLASVETLPAGTLGVVGL